MNIIPKLPVYNMCSMLHCPLFDGFCAFRSVGGIAYSTKSNLSLILLITRITCTSFVILYIYWLGMRVIALLLSPRYQLFSEATPRNIVGTEGTIKVILPEYQVYKCFIILNNCACQNSKLQALFWWISSLLY